MRVFAPNGESVDGTLEKLKQMLPQKDPSKAQTDPTTFLRQPTARGAAALAENPTVRRVLILCHQEAPECRELLVAIYDDAVEHPSWGWGRRTCPSPPNAPHPNDRDGGFPLMMGTAFLRAEAMDDGFWEYPARIGMLRVLEMFRPCPDNLY